MSVTEAINDFYKLKETYENAIQKDKKKIIDNKMLSWNEKRNEYKQLKPKCVNCKRPVGTFFSSKLNSEMDVRQLKAICGSLTEPCDLNITINLGEYYNIMTNVNDLEKELSEQKNKIIDDKNKLLFGYLSSQDVINRFDKIKENIDTITYLLNIDYELLFNILDNKTKKDQLNILQEEIYILIEQIKEYIANYNSTNDTQQLKNAVEIYVNQLDSKLKDLQKVKYAVNIVEFVPEQNVYRLIQKKYGIEQLENFIVESTVEKFDIGVVSKSKSKTKKYRQIEAPKSKTMKKRKKLIIVDEESVEEQKEQQEQEEELESNKPKFNDDKTVTWENSDYQNIWSKLSKNYKEVLLTDKEWLQETMDKYVENKKNKKTVEFVNPSNLIIPPQILDDGSYDFGNDFYNNYFNSLEPSYKKTMLTLYSTKNGVKDYNMLLDNLSRLLKEKFDLPNFF
jgi:hypothetical protein